ncbi:MAG: U32 family peptidase [Candidatus Marinimicrobia bacterium]|nr:U32 family peptidase [Candidatus Neomarinimicrobiota bacterium]
MTHQHKNIEIMAPVGSYDALMAALQGGADSVYFGVENLNMRSRSSNNFTLDDLKNIASIAQKNQVKTYLTLNTIIYDHEIELMKRIVDTAKEAEITAVIASDISVIQYAHSKMVEVHISTQANVTNIEAVKFYAQFADVMVTARELTIDQLAEITRQIRLQNITGPKGELIRIEIFAHGALCMAVSGKCYLSLHAMNQSANRGACLQVCRRSYRLVDIEMDNQIEVDNEYLMSPKDLWTIHFLNKILDAGVSVLKIEGRARSPEYVRTVVECYSEAVDAWYNDDYTDDRIDVWKSRLESVFNRGFWNGYYLGQRLGEWNHRYGSRATQRKVFIGRVTNYYTNLQVAEISPDANQFSIGDRLLITGPTTGVKYHDVQEIRENDQSVTTTKQGVPCSIKIEAKLRRSDKVFKIVDADQVKQQ